MVDQKEITCAIIGSTGSIGMQTLEVIDLLKHRGFQIKVVGLAANQNPEFHQQLSIYTPRGFSFQGSLPDYPSDCRRFSNVIELLDFLRPDYSVIASSGGITLAYTLKALEVSRRVCLANKESIVLGGEQIIRKARQKNTELIPVDSEHSGVFQLLQGMSPQEIKKVYLTASGGALRDWPEDQKNSATVEQVLKHPNWKMGAKITVDSATLLNKALEMIEAKFLFGLTKDQIDVAFCYNSFVHSFIEMADGHYKIHAGFPDMRVPIAYSLTYPHREPLHETCEERAKVQRIGHGTGHTIPRLRFQPIPWLRFQPIPWLRLQPIPWLRLHQDPAPEILSIFEPIQLMKADFTKHAALRLGAELMASPNSLRIALNASNEVAVELFLDRKIAFGSILTIVEKAVQSQEAYEIEEFDEIVALHGQIKRELYKEYP